MVRLIRIAVSVVIIVLLGLSVCKLQRMLIIRGMMPGGHVCKVTITDKTVVNHNLRQEFFITWNGHDIHTISTNRVALSQNLWLKLEVGDNVNIVYFKNSGPYLQGAHISNQQIIQQVIWVSVLATLLSVLFYFELSAQRAYRAMRRRRVSLEKQRNTVSSGNTTSIYALPPTKEEWDVVRKYRSSRKRHGHKHHHHSATSKGWGIYINIIAIFWVMTYVLMAAGYTAVTFYRGGEPIIAFLLWIMMLFVSAAAAGILQRRQWGQSLGFVLCVLHLIVFPVGSIFGLLMSLGLIVGCKSFS